MSISHAWNLSSDAELITAVRSGEPSAFGVLYERHESAARSVARQYSNSSADAEDAVADAFSRVFSTIQDGGGPDVAFRAYLFTVVRRVALKRVDSGRRATPTDDLETFEAAAEVVESTETPTMAGFERGVVSQAYRSLPERWQAVLWYTEVEELSPAEIAPVLGLTANGVAALAYRAREGLRQAYLQQHLAAPTSEACTLVNSKLGAYVRGGLAKRETALVESHLDECGSCRALVLELGDVNHGMRVVIAPLVLGAAAITVLKGLGFGGAAGAVGAAGAGAGVGAGAGGATGTGAGAGAGAGGATGAGAGAGGAAGAGAGAGAGAAGTGAGVGAGAGAGVGVGAGSGAAAVAGAGVSTGALAGASAAAAGLTVVGAGAANLMGAQTASASAAGGAGTAGAAGTVGTTAGLVGAGAGATAAAGGGLAAVLGGIPLVVGIATVGVVAAGALGVAGLMGAFSGPDAGDEPPAVAAPEDGGGVGSAGADATDPAGTGTGTQDEVAAPTPTAPPADPTAPTNLPDDAAVSVDPPAVVSAPGDGTLPGSGATAPGPTTPPPTTDPEPEGPEPTAPPVNPDPTPDPDPVPDPAAYELTVGPVEAVGPGTYEMTIRLANIGGTAGSGLGVEVTLPQGFQLAPAGTPWEACAVGQCLNGLALDPLVGPRDVPLKLVVAGDVAPGAYEIPVLLRDATGVVAQGVLHVTVTEPARIEPAALFGAPGTCLYDGTSSLTVPVTLDNTASTVAVKFTISAAGESNQTVAAGVSTSHDVLVPGAGAVVTVSAETTLASLTVEPFSCEPPACAPAWRLLGDYGVDDVVSHRGVNYRLEHWPTDVGELLEWLFRPPYDGHGLWTAVESCGPAQS